MGYLFFMRRVLFWLALYSWLAAGLSAQAATGRIMKVLPFFLDVKGRQALSPSLYERDSYQAQLRLHPEHCSGIRFAVEWKARPPVWEPLKLKVELRGIAQGSTPRQLTFEEDVKSTGWFGRWSSFNLTGDDYKAFGEVTAWRVSIWEGEKLLGEQKSFLW
jgi:hypothetical protein